MMGDRGGPLGSDVEKDGTSDRERRGADSGDSARADGCDGLIRVR
jgi:hypothetical protein